MCAKSKTRGIDVAIVVLSVVVIACAVWFGYLLGQRSVVEGMSKAIEEATPAQQSVGGASSVETGTASSGTGVFEGQTMSVIFEGVEDAPYLDGACNITFIAENRSGIPCTFAIDLQSATASGFGVMPLGGSLSVVQPGNKVALVYNLAYKQFEGASIGDLTDFTADVVQYRGESMMNADGSTTEIDRVHVSVAP